MTLNQQEEFPAPKDLGALDSCDIPRASPRKGMREESQAITKRDPC
jgi:hypothetical protein